MVLKNKKGQAAAEFAVMLPLLLVLFAGVYQLAVISLRMAEINMLEREVMRYFSGARDNDKKAGSVRKFAREIAEKQGLNPERLHVKLAASKTEADEETRDFLNMNYIKSGLFKANWKYIIITYEQELTPMFSLIAGKEKIKLNTTLYAARGGVFEVTPGSIGEWAGSFLGRGQK